jgi:hypothetical protein
MAVELSNGDVEKNISGSQHPFLPLPKTNV